jgi:hypothetical protein
MGFTRRAYFADFLFHVFFADFFARRACLIARRFLVFRERDAFLGVFVLFAMR